MLCSKCLADKFVETKDFASPGLGDWTAKIGEGIPVESYWRVFEVEKTRTERATWVALQPERRRAQDGCRACKGPSPLVDFLRSRN